MYVQRNIPRIAEFSRIIEAQGPWTTQKETIQCQEIVTWKQRCPRQSTMAQMASTKRIVPQNCGLTKHCTCPSFIHPSRFEFLLSGLQGFNLLNTSIQISPEKFAPERLCACPPGWILGCFQTWGTPGERSCKLPKERSFTVEDIGQGLCPLCLQHEMPRIGSGALCQKCPRDSFKEGFSSKQCTPCPPGSTALVGSTSVDDCKCKAGKLYNSFGTWTLFSTWQPFPCCSMFPNFIVTISFFGQKSEMLPCAVITWFSS